MEAPTVVLVKGQVPETFPWSSLGYDDDAELQKLVDVANRYVERCTGLAFLHDPAASTIAVLDEPLVLEAVTLSTVQLAYQRRKSYMSGAADDLVASFSAGSYSEARRDNSSRGGGSGKMPRLNPWPRLDDLLWMLMTPDQYDFWMERLGGQIAPYFTVTEMDWTGDLGLAGAGVVPGFPGLGVWDRDPFDG